jgi:hypothetical protein
MGKGRLTPFQGKSPLALKKSTTRRANTVAIPDALKINGSDQPAVAIQSMKA